MPTYTFFDTTAKEEVSLFMSMSEREQYLEDNPHMQQTLVNVLPYVDPIMLGRLNKEGRNFQTNVIDRIAQTVPGNNLKNSRFRQNLNQI